ncbi:MAG: hypothetical protein LUI05_09655 [Oscillospiraceae bacterium]|nr:hypothetical protein [Oscillospiraceae bacterium]
MVIHTIINEYDLLYAQEREMSFAVQKDSRAASGDFLPISDLSLCAEDFSLNNEGDIIL